MLADLSDGPLDDESNADTSLESAAADNELVKFVNKVIVDAYNLKASDIHIEPLPGKAKTGIRLRIDGSLQPYIEVPSHFRQALVTRLKIMCDLDISEKRLPQDGRINFKAHGIVLDIRVSTVPTIYAESISLRLLNQKKEAYTMDRLGMSQEEQAQITHRVEITGDDSPGLVARLSEALPKFGANIVRLNSESVPSESGARFLLRMAIAVPPAKAATSSIAPNTATKPNGSA